MQAIEAELLLHNIYHGFPVLPEEDVQPQQVPPISVPNYPCPATAAAAIRKGIDEELAQGILYELPGRPAQCSPLTYNGRMRAERSVRYGITAPRTMTALRSTIRSPRRISV